MVSISRLLSEWPQDGETSQVILDLDSQRCDNLCEICEIIACFAEMSEIVSYHRITNLTLIFIVLSHLSALESGTSSGFFSALSSPIGITRHNISYDEHMDAPMHSPPPDLSVNILWKDPVIPQHKFRNAAEVLSCLFSPA